MVDAVPSNTFPHPLSSPSPRSTDCPRIGSRSRISAGIPTDLPRASKRVAQHSTTQHFSPRAPERYSCYKLSTKPHETFLLPVLDVVQQHPKRVSAARCIARRAHTETQGKAGEVRWWPPPICISKCFIVTSLNVVRAHVQSCVFIHCSYMICIIFPVLSVLFFFHCLYHLQERPSPVKKRDCPTVDGICTSYISQGRAQHFILQHCCRARIYYMPYTSSLPQCSCCFFP